MPVIARIISIIGVDQFIIDQHKHSETPTPDVRVKKIAAGIHGKVTVAGMDKAKGWGCTIKGKNIIRPAFLQAFF